MGANKSMYTPEELALSIRGRLQRNFGRTPETASPELRFRACAMAIFDLMGEVGVPEQTGAPPKKQQDEREVHYLSLEFLLGRSLMKNAFNLGVLEPLGKALLLLNLNLSDIAEEEPDAGLGNGGLGRLAACYLEAMTSLGIRATGYSLCYQFGIFVQRILDGEQIEQPDPWYDKGSVWLSARADDAVSVSFGGDVVFYKENERMKATVRNDTKVLAVPLDMTVNGYGRSETNKLRLWQAKSPAATAIDMEQFSEGNYMQATEQDAMARVINMVLYPNDNHMEGKMLRLRQQYFFVSATAQSIVRRHKRKHGNLQNFHRWNVIQINDTHPTLIIPELMRIFMDEEGISWERAWQIVTNCVAYTNHTVLAEALESWPNELIEMLLPRIWMILCEINKRSMQFYWEAFGDEDRVSRSAIIWGNHVHMANLCVYSCFAVNGVSALHSNILRDDLFKSQAALWPNKFHNVTNGVDHRRWLSQINPRLHTLLCDTLDGDSYLTRASALEGLLKKTGDTALLEELGKIKRENKIDFAAFLQKTRGVKIDSSSVFDVQVKRLHEYKRQLLNALHILHLYNTLKDNPSADFLPRTFIFGAKAAPGYYIAKRIIRLIHSIAAHIAADPAAKGKLSVVFLENYSVSLAERLIPASEVSEQISTAGKEASGTGNMKFMLNGANTVGTLDGANVEIAELVGPENIFIFGLKADEVEQMHRDGYSPMPYVARNPALRRVLDQLTGGLSDGVEYADLVHGLLIGGYEGADPYFLMADFEGYCACHREVEAAYRDTAGWNKRSLINIAKSGFFAADRSTAEYARNIWNVPLG
ncbi:MAG: glycogen/starch/alpha-glucan family phosphorylase [Oscillospiraceae bacterium]|jgi:starch phosphorylase|nr:glycogen/starch/alpha-glucan family phosphorylase [Oscillospiraceae bacterium]